jgi:predicted dehydrogenase
MKRIGIAGIGHISGIYLENLTGMFNRRVKLTAVTDKLYDRAEKAAANYRVKAFKSVEELANCDEVDIVLNITPPKNHHEVALIGIKAGKHD